MISSHHWKKNNTERIKLAHTSLGVIHGIKLLHGYNITKKKVKSTLKVSILMTTTILTQIHAEQNSFEFPQTN